MTDYTAYVVTDCDGELSAASTTISFRTACSTIETYPYFEGFNSSYNFQDVCWSSQAISGNTNWNVNVAGAYGNDPYEGQYCAKITYFVGETRLISPVFDLSEMNNPYLKYVVANPTYEGNAAQVIVEYKATPESDWVTLKSHTTANETWLLDSVALPSPSETYQIAFKAIGANAWGASIDAIHVYDAEGEPSNPDPEPEPCDAPTDLAVSNITENSADVSWNGTATTYELRLNGGEAETLTTTSKQLIGLPDNFTITVEVRAICGEQTSEWVSTTFTTLAVTDPDPEPCDAPTALVASNITETTAEITWTGSAEAYEFKLNGGSAETLTATTKALTGLTPATAYTVEVRSICGEQTSEWVSTSFTTLEEQVVIELGQVTTTPATEVGNTSATLNGALVSAGNSENYTVGFALATVADFTLEDADVQNITATLTDATFSQAVNDLAEGQTYFFRAYITNEAGTAYGAVETFTLSGLNDAIANGLTATIYPNPANTQATLQINGLNQDAKIVISDIQGRILSQEEISASTTTYTINLNNMASGVYYVRIVTDNVISTQKLIVE